MCKITGEGVHVGEPYVIKGNWEHRFFKEETNEKTRGVIF
jgi:hypothetical protein